MNFLVSLLITIFFFSSFATTSHAITITGSETITTNSSASYSAADCNGTVTWSVTGTGASISSNGVLTIGSASCGGITVTASCSDGSIATKTARVTDAGGWILLRYAVCTEGTNAYTACPVETDYSSEIQGKYKMAYWTHTSKSLHWNADGTTPVLGEGCLILQQLGFTKNNNWGIGTNERAIGYGTCPGVIIQNSYKSLNAYIWEWQCPPCTSGQTISCYTGTGGTQGVGICKAGTQTCTGGQWGACVGEVLPQAEICGDGKDNNCDGQIDEGCCNVSVSVYPSEVWPKNTGSSQTNATITVSLINTAPPEGCAVTLTVEPVTNSGGHSHIGTRPKGTLSRSSLPLTEPETVTYTSGEVSGEERIIAMATGGHTSEATVTVRVPNLIYLGAGQNYSLKPPTAIHPSSYWSAMDVIGYFISIANAYTLTFPNDERLVVTDISLPKGGMFDLCGTYNPQDTCSNASKGGHSRHRTGRNTDVRKWNIPARNVKEFIKICRYYNAQPGDHGDHYHLTFK